MISISIITIVEEWLSKFVEWKVKKLTNEFNSTLLHKIYIELIY